MRSTIIVYLAAVALLSGCAFQGVIVEKRFRPLPFPDSLGVDGMYNFQLRDRAGQIHSQMVTPEVFSLYEVGDYFDDLQPPPSTGGKDLKAVRPAPVEWDQLPYQPVKTTQRHQRHYSKIAQTRRRPHYIALA
ncbi:MAG: hypothetical protein M3O66_05735 [Verrucomicrobiota bacterium]|nr:hypothetical protein [Verrucomicrobiota bacterium]